MNRKQMPSRAEQIADNILRAAGSGLRHYTMPASREKIIAAAQEACKAHAELVDAATKYIDQVSDALDGMEQRDVELYGKLLGTTMGAGADLLIAIAKAREGA